MVRKALLLVGLTIAVGVSGCTETGRMKVPFTKDAPFVATAVPGDFAVVVDENHDTYYARQHIRQEIGVATATSRTQYTTFRDYNNTVSNNFSQETPLSQVQLQNMWNAVLRYDLLNRSTIWVNWLSGADLYKRDTFTVQIRAHGQTRSYRATNGFPGAVRPLMLHVEAVRLPVSVNSATRVVGGMRDSETMPATVPATLPGEWIPAPMPEIKPMPGVENSGPQPAASQPATEPRNVEGLTR